jgi:hypothetical protein
MNYTSDTTYATDLGYYGKQPSGALTYASGRPYTNPYRYGGVVALIVDEKFMVYAGHRAGVVSAVSRDTTCEAPSRTFNISSKSQ